MKRKQFCEKCGSDNLSHPKNWFCDDCCGEIIRSIGGTDSISPAGPNGEKFQAKIRES